jgi:HSP20 family molecular chaperone IbpA
VSWEIRGPWPSVEEVEWRFEELIRTRWRVVAQPPADIYLVGDEMYVEIDAAGVEAEDVRVRVEAETVVVEGVRRRRLPRDDVRFVRLERPSGPFRRVFALPPHLRRPHLEVSFAGGVMRVRVGPAAQRSVP